MSSLFEQLYHLESRPEMQNRHQLVCFPKQALALLEVQEPSKIGQPILQLLFLVVLRQFRIPDPSSIQIFEI